MMTLPKKMVLYDAWVNKTDVVMEMIYERKNRSSNVH